MSSYSKEMLREIILDHYDAPNNKIENDTLDNKQYLSFHNKSATCIDDIKVFLKIENNLIVDLKFFGVGCAISTSSTDILCDLLKNKTKQQALIIIDNYKKMINNEPFDKSMLNELIAFNEIYKQQNRIKCSLIGINAIERIINDWK